MLINIHLLMKILKYILLSILYLITLSVKGQEWPLEKSKILSEATCVKNSPDKRIAVGSASGNIFLFNPKTNGLDNTLKGQTGLVYQLSFSPDGNLLVSCGKGKGGKGGEVHVWDVKKGIEKYNLKGHSSNVVSASVNYDGTLLATGDKEGKIIIWDLKTSELLKTYTDHNESIGELEFAHRSNLLATSDLEGVIEVYNVDKHEVVRKMTAGKKGIRTIVWGPRDQYIASGGDAKEIKLWDINLGYSTIVLQGHKKSIRHLSYSPDGNYIFSVLDDNTIKLWDLKTSEVKSTLSGGYKFIDCHVSYDGKRLAIADYEKFAKYYDITSLGIKENNDLNQYKDLFVSGTLVNDAPSIEIIQPLITDGENYITKEALFDIKGKVTAPAGLFLLLVNGQETEVDENGYFKSRVELDFAKNNISIKAIDILKQTTEKTVLITRPFYAGLVDKSQLRRRGKDYALLIGTDSYQSMGDLKNPVNDVKTIAEELRTVYGFETDTLLNPTMNEVYAKILKLNQREFSDEDQLFIFIAGHGQFDPLVKQGYLVCRDSDTKNDPGHSTLISYAYLRGLINNIPCKHVCLMLDACFGGTFDPLVASRGEQQNNEVAKNEFILRKLKLKSRLYITSGGKEYVPDGRPGQHSPFTRQFLKSLRNEGGEDGILTMAEVKSYTESLKPAPLYGQFGDNEPGSDFLFIKKK